jgi:hypothetical protein
MSILKFTIQMCFWTNMTRSNMPPLVIQHASMRRLSWHSCSGWMPPILQHLVQQRCGQFTCYSVISPNIPDPSQLLVQQSIWHTYPHYLTHSMTSSSHSIISGALNKVTFLPIVNENSCMQYGSSSSIMTSFMHTPMGWLCDPWMESSNGCIHASWPIQQITVRSTYFTLIYLCSGTYHPF